MAMELFKNFERIPHSFGFSNHYLASAIALLNSFFFLTANTGYNNKVNSENIYNEANEGRNQMVRQPSRKAPGKVYR